MFNPVYETNLLFIEWQVLRSGRLKPVAHFIPFKHNGKTFSQAPVNMDFIQKISGKSRNFLIHVKLSPKPEIVNLIQGEVRQIPFPFNTPGTQSTLSTPSTPVTPSTFLCPYCGSPVLPSPGRRDQGEVVELFCSRPDICPAQSGNIETVQRANPHLRVAFPFYTSEKARFVHACNAFGCIPVPIKDKESCYDFMVLSPDEQTYGKIGFFMGVTQWSITPPERIPTPDLIKQIRNDNPILKYY